MFFTWAILIKSGLSLITKNPDLDPKENGCIVLRLLTPCGSGVESLDYKMGPLKHLHLKIIKIVGGNHTKSCVLHVFTKHHSAVKQN